MVGKDSIVFCLRYVDAFFCGLTLYMDLWDNEIISYGLRCRKGDRKSTGDSTFKKTVADFA